MGFVHANEPFFAKTPDGPVSVDPKTPYREDDFLVTTYPSFFRTDEELDEAGEGSSVGKVSVTNKGARGIKP